MNKLNKIAALVALVAVSASASAQAIDNWRGTDGTVWKNGTNELCWRDNFWTPATGVQGCDGVPAPAAPAPAAPAPAPRKPAYTGPAMLGAEDYGTLAEIGGALRRRNENRRSCCAAGPNPVECGPQVRGTDSK